MRFAGVDRQLLERCQRGDLCAFEQLCRTVQQELYGYIYAILRNHDDTDEALQECLVRVHRHLAKLDDLDKFPWWLARMAVNQCRTHQARNAAQRLYPLEEGVEVPNERVVGNASQRPSARELMERRELMGEIEHAMEMLPPRQRTSIVLYEIHEHSVKEIAELMECSEGAVKFHLHEARKKLKLLLSEHLRRSPKTAEPGGAP